MRDNLAKNKTIELEEYLMNYSIKLFTNAIGPAREKSRFTYLNFFGEKVDIPYNIWLIEGNGQKILVDTGCNAHQYITTMNPDNKDFFTEDSNKFNYVIDKVSLEDGLQQWGLKPEDIDTVILTHLHFDHIMNVNKFINAQIIVQQKEWQTALNPHTLNKFAYAPRSFYESLKNLKFINGDVELVPGINLLLTPGHSPGGQSILVQTEKGKYAIAGFCTIHDNFYPPKELQQKIGYSIIPAGMHYNSYEVYNSALRLVEAADVILPTHEISLTKNGGVIV